MKKLLLLSWGALIFLSCNDKPINQKQESGSSSTHVTNTKVVLRETPNKNSKAIDTLEMGEKLEYIKETRFKEIIPVNNNNKVMEWVYGSTDKSMGWIYSALITPTTQFNQKIENDFDFKNRIFNFVYVYKGIESDKNFENCTFNLESDCGYGSMYFFSDGTFIKNDLCLGGDTRKAGRYTLKDGELLCSFNATYLFGDYDDENNIKEELRKGKPDTKKLKIKYCNKNQIYLFTMT